MPLYALIPDNLRPGDRCPAVLAPHGHSSGGKMRSRAAAISPAVAATIEEHNYDYGVQFVRQGWAFAHAAGFGERREAARQDEANLLFGSCNLLNHMAIPLGQTLTGMWTWTSCAWWTTHRPARRSTQRGSRLRRAIRRGPADAVAGRAG